MTIRTLLLRLIPALTLVATSPGAWSQEDAVDTSATTLVPRGNVFTTEGREFWVVFQKNFRDFVVNEKTQAQEPAAALELELFITSSKTTKVTIDIPGIDFHQERTLRAGRVINVQIDSAAQLRSAETIEQLGVHIVSEEPVAVYGLNRRYQTTDTYLAHPVNVLGKTYRAMGYRWLQNDLLSQLAIVATQPNTRVKITPSVTTNGGTRLGAVPRPAGVPFEVTLNRGDAYQVIPKYDPNGTSDLTGTIVEADKPIAVFSGHNCAYVPDLTVKACNLLVEQLPAVQSWGRQFFVGTLAARSSAVLRVLASVDNTQVFENGRLVSTLKAGDFYENRDQREHTLITASDPVLVAQFSKGFDNGDNVGDPMMIVVAPTEQFLSAYRFATPVRGSWRHYVNLIAPTATLAELKLDGQRIDAKKFRPFGLSRYSIGQIDVPYGTHTVEGPEPFGLYSYGFGYDDAAYDAYGNGGGQSVEIVVELPDTMPPLMDVRLDRATATITAIARDDRVGDKGFEEIIPVDYENLSIGNVEFQRGSPLVPINLMPQDPKLNAYALFRLRDRAGNASYQTICVKYDELGDSISVRVLPNGASCDFAPRITFSGLIKYSVLDHHATIPAGSEELDNPLELRASGGKPAWGFHAGAELAYRSDIVLVGRAGLDFWNADAFGYPDSITRRADDGQVISEEFHLERSSAMFTLGAGANYFIVDRRAYLFGMLNFSLPISSSERLTRTILTPANHVYPNGEGTMVMYEGGGPSGLALAIVPELGIGGAIDLRGGLRIFGELGYGFGLTTISPDRDWTVSYPFGRMGAKIRF
ncbi:MAG TPA: IgGFc-binding protein [Candidatus Kapabacteria bacterium]|nr:IgGFc-binding protein [Candidatus Kapabacteria bacterium]